MASPAYKLPAVVDNGNPQLTAAINASVLTIVLKAADGAKLPTTYSGTATSTGTATLLNATGIGSSGVAVGDFIENVTDGSFAVIKTVSSNSVTTTALKGGSGNTWANTNAWAVNRFVACLAKVNSSGVITQSELVLVNSRSTDTLTVATGGRGHDGSTANTFAADDYCFLIVARNHVQELQKAIRNHEMKFDELRSGAWNYAADAGGSDAYAVTLDPAASALAAGMRIWFKANTQNTGACTLNPNGLGATALKMPNGQDPPDGYIRPSSLVDCIHDGTNFVILSVSSTPGAGTVKSNTDGGTVTFDLSVSDTHTVTLGGNRTLALSNGQDGQVFTVVLKQDGAGSRAATWWSNIKWAGGVAPTLTTTASKADTFGFLRISSTEYYGFIVGQNL